VRWRVLLPDLAQLATLAYPMQSAYLLAVATGGTRWPGTAESLQKARERAPRTRRTILTHRGMDALAFGRRRSCVAAGWMAVRWRPAGRARYGVQG
jgi:hypothetical protein